METTGAPADAIDEDLVHGLLRAQRPDLAELPLRYYGRGWGNEMWRLGEELALRIPRTENAPELLRREYSRLPELASRLPLPVPTPLFLGEPSALFPQPWSVVTWVAGEPADRAEIKNAESVAVLGDFLRALYSADVPNDLGWSGKTRHLCGGSNRFSEEATELLGEDRVRTLEEIWQDGAGAPKWSGPAVWIHGDLHPANVVTQDGALAGVIDFGELGPGDPAADLIAAWTLLPSGSTSEFFAHYGEVDEATMRRARACAVSTGSFVLQMAINGMRGLPGGKPGWLAAGRKTLDRVLEVC